MFNKSRDFDAAEAMRLENAETTPHVQQVIADAADEKIAANMVYVARRRAGSTPETAAAETMAAMGWTTREPDAYQFDEGDIDDVEMMCC